MTRKCFVRPQYLSSPQESWAAGFGRPNSRQGYTKCRAPDSSNKCRNPFRVLTAWAHGYVEAGLKVLPEHLLMRNKESYEKFVFQRHT